MAAKKAQEVEAAPALVCPRAAERAKAEAAAKNDASAKGKGHRGLLNEVSVMSELDKKRVKSLLRF